MSNPKTEKRRNNDFSKFFNNTIASPALKQVKGGEDEIIITEDCLDL